MTTILVDGHAHFYGKAFSVRRWIDAACRNLVDTTQELGLSGPVNRLLLVADNPHQDTFRFLGRVGRMANSDWSFDRVGKSVGVLVDGPDGEPLVLVRCRQSLSRERLEVLSVALDGELPLDLGFHQLVTRSLDQAPITILPYGFAKWTGTRGRLVQKVIDSNSNPGLFVGDSGTRMNGTRPPRLIARAGSRGILNIPGSDPLPIAGEEDRVGARGAVLAGEFRIHSAVEHLRRLLLASQSQPPTFGNGMSPARFISAQIRMQLRQRFKKRASRGSKGIMR